MTWKTIKSAPPGARARGTLAALCFAPLVTASAAQAQGQPALAELTPAVATVESSGGRGLDVARVELRLAELEQRARNAEARAELATKPAPTPVVVADDKGFSFKSADDAYGLRLKGLLVIDGRKYLGDEAAADLDTFLVRKVRPIFEVTALKIADLRLNLDFAEGKVVVVDAYADIKPTGWVKLRVGKFIAPVGLERNQQDTEMVFTERSLVGNLTSARDVGLLASVDVAGGIVHAAAGVFDGAPDTVNLDLDNNQGKDVGGRLWVQPFKRGGALGHLGFGVAGSTGKRKGQALRDRTALAPYRTSGQSVFFEYLAGATPAEVTYTVGQHRRINPQLFYFVGSLGFIAEYSVSSQLVVRDTNQTRLSHRGLQTTLSYAFGGLANLSGTVVKNRFASADGGLGVLELAVRYAALNLDDDTFPTFADPNRSAAGARSFGALASWHLSRNLKFAFNYEQTFFRAASAPGVTFARKDERVLIGRTQFVF